MVGFQKISIQVSLMEGQLLKILRGGAGGGAPMLKLLRLVMKLYCNFQGGGGWGPNQNTFHRRGMDIFCNKTL